jgi:hypothetical protein
MFQTNYWTELGLALTSGIGERFSQHGVVDPRLKTSSVIALPTNLHVSTFKPDTWYLNCILVVPRKAVAEVPKIGDL